MTYKVFFVEDEIVTREGIRDNVDWKANGFEFCGEASDGEIALQLLQTVKPDVLITDIKMPFMDGLQLSKIVRECMPSVEIVILSGHDEFEYAQAAIKLGVSEYLLKPVTVQNLNEVLQKIATKLDREKIERDNLRKLQDQVAENQAVLAERFLLKLVVGAVSSTEAIEKSQLLGLDLIARYYLVVIIKTEFADLTEQFDYDEYKYVQQIITNIVDTNPDVFLLKKDWEELIILMKGNTPEYLQEERDLLLEQIRREVTGTRYQLVIGVGEPKNRTAYIYQSFVEALVAIQNASNSSKADSKNVVDKTALLMVDKSAVENYLRSGVKEDFDAFFDAFIRPIGETALKSYLIKNYIFVDVVLATTKFLVELGGNIDQAVSEFNSIETILANIKTTEQLKEQVYKILVSALAFRDNKAASPYAGIIQQAKEYIEHHYTDPNLMLNEAAARVNLSPSYFSVIFSQETGQTFKEYLTEIRIKKAKELLRTTSLKSVEIAYQIGYSDPHYFSFVFKKNTALSPAEFRLQGQPEHKQQKALLHR
ncbi:MAG: response regulator [Anaerolineaceae bacterium]|nr:response regulator [Anaerolineaceae bacterium]